MGTPVPSPFDPPDADPGVPCGVCWGLGKTFGDVDTPDTIHAIVSGVNKGDAWTPDFPLPPNGTYVLTQTPLFPCRYHEVTYPTLVVEFGPNFTEIFGFANDDFVVYFEARTNDICIVDLDNTAIGVYTGGSVKVFV